MVVGKIHSRNKRGFFQFRTLLSILKCYQTMIFTLTVIGVFGIYFIDKFIQERKKTKRYIQRFKDLMNED